MAQQVFGLIDEVQDYLKQNRIVFDLQKQADVDLLRAEAEHFTQAMREAKGRETDRPRMYCSGLIDDPGAARNLTGFPDLLALVVSVGGTYTHMRAVQIQRGQVIPRSDLLVSRQGQDVPKERVPTPCSDYQEHPVKQMVDEIAKYLVPWYVALLKESQPITLVINWGFPQQAVRLTDGSGLTGAIGQSMTKAQSGVQAQGQPLHEVFCRSLQQALKKQGLDLPEGFQVVVQNDTISSVYRYLLKSTRERYREIALMIMGTGTNLTSAEPYLTQTDGSFVLNEEGLPQRLDRFSQDGKEGRENVWVNYEIGRLLPQFTLDQCDCLRTEDEGKIELDIESFGLAGIGYLACFLNLIEDTFDDPKQIRLALEESCACFSIGRVDLGAEWITSLAGRHALQDQENILDSLSRAGLGHSQIQSLVALAGAVISRSAQRAGIILAAMSLFNGFGLDFASAKPDALALEGSLWKIKGFREEVFEVWQSILKSEIKKAGSQALNAVFLFEDDYNAGVLGPAYMLGQFLNS